MATATKLSPLDQRIILKRVSWKTYESLLSDHLDRSVPRLAYDQGVLEIVSPSRRHEETNRTLGHLIEVVAEELSTDLLNVGSMTFKRKDLQQGFEPDTSFYIQHEPEMFGMAEIDAATDPPPDLVIEIDVTSPSLNKLPIYARMRVPEIWRYREQTDDVVVLRLQNDTYQEVTQSETLPPLTNELLTRFVAESRTMRRTEWVRSVRAWARTQQRSGDE